MKLVLTFGLIFGTVNTYGTVIGIITQSLDYTDADASIFGAVFIIGGLVGSGILGGYVETTKKYKLALITICIVALVSPFFLMFCLSTHKIWLASISCFVIGMELSILPIGIDFGVELTYPIAESISTGLLMSMAQLVSIVCTIAVSTILAEIPKS